MRRQLPSMVMERADFFVFHKPPGWFFSEKPYDKEIDLENPDIDVPFQYWVRAFLQRYRPEFKLPPPVCNAAIRKDLYTTGPIVFAKRARDTMPIRLSLSDKGDGADAAVKVYACVVHGRPTPRAADIVAPIHCESVPSGRSAYQLCRVGEGKHAASSYTTSQLMLGRATKSPYALVRVRIFTGRTHQVRVHMASIGCPLAGDDRYETPEQNAAARADGFARYLLHNEVLCFTHKGERADLSLPPPPAFERAVERAARVTKTYQPKQNNQ